MPCCCATNVQAAFVLGIIGVVLNLAETSYSIVTGEGHIALGILGALISAFLVLGSYLRNHKFLKSSMINILVHCVCVVILEIVASVKNKRKYAFPCLLTESTHTFRDFWFQRNTRIMNSGLCFYCKIPKLFKSLLF